MWQKIETKREDVKKESREDKDKVKGVMLQSYDVKAVSAEREAQKKEVQNSEGVGGLM